MDIRLKPEVEAMIRQGVERGPYNTPEELVEQAISEFHEREDYLAQHRATVAQKIEEGWESARQGPLIDGEEAEASMEARMKAWPRTTPNK
jgi:Arc/MetJ-type ribon-helix-helix transcriptional regulator